MRGQLTIAMLSKRIPGYTQVDGDMHDRFSVLTCDQYPLDVIFGTTHASCTLAQLDYLMT